MPPYNTGYKNPSKTYANQLREYANKLEGYGEEIRKYNASFEEIKRLVVELIKKETNFYSIVPEKSQDKVWLKAYNDTIEHGYYAVYQELEELVSLFK